MGTIMLVTTYWKGSNTFQKDKPAARFLPLGLSQLLLKYLAFIRPLETFFANLLSENQFGSFSAATSLIDYKEFLFVSLGKKMDPKDINNAFSKTFKTLVGINVSFSLYRQIAQAFANKKIRYTAEVDDLDSLNSFVDKQAGRSVAVSGTFYGRTVSEDHNSLSRDARETFFRVSQQWHALLKVDEPKRRERRHNNNSIDQAPADTTPMDLASTICCANGSFCQGPMTVVAHIVTSSSAKRKLHVFLNDNDDHEVIARCLLALRQLYTASAQFKSPSQALACQLVAAREKDVLVVLPTGGGKTAVVFVPVQMEKTKTTVIVLPLIALLHEMLDRCSLFGFTTLHWRNTQDCEGSFNPRNPPQIICVSVENAVCQKFVEALKIMTHVNVLSRIVIDEAHLALTTSSYRAKMVELLLLKTLTVPLLLSATVPPAMEPLMHIRFGSEFVTIRESTVRKTSFMEQFVLKTYHQPKTSYVRQLETSSVI